MSTRLVARRVHAIACGIALLTLLEEAATGLQTAARVPQDSRPPLRYFVSDGDAGTGYRPSDRELALWAFEAWERSAAGSFRLEPAPEEDALVRVYWVPPNGSYGETRSLLARRFDLSEDEISVKQLVATKNFGNAAPPLLIERIVPALL